MRIDHVLNSSLVSGPETLLVPNLAGSGLPVEFVLLQETRRAAGAGSVAAYVRRHGMVAREFGVDGRWDRGAIGAVAASWAADPPALVHAHGPKATTYAVAAIARLLPAQRRGIRIVTTHHGVMMNDRTLALRAFEFVYERYAMPRCDLCLTVCSSDRERLRSRGVRAPLAVHWNGVDRPRPTAEERQRASVEARRRWADASGVAFDGRPVVGIVGRLSGEKRQALALQALARLDAARRPILVLAGSGPDEARLRELARASGLATDVAFVGWREHWITELPGLDVVLSVSSAEGLPIALVEAGWAERAVMATAVGGVADLVPSDSLGYPLPPRVAPDALAAALAAALGDPAERAARAARYAQHVRDHFSREAWLTALRATYARVLGTGMAT